MKHALLIAILLCLPCAAIADGGWVITSIPDGSGSVGYDTASLSSAKTANHKLITTMLYVKSPQDFGGKSANFMLNSVEFDCSAKSTHTISAKAYDADGKSVGEMEGDGFSPITDDPWMEFVQPVACEGQTFQGGASASDLTDAMQKMKAR